MKTYNFITMNKIVRVIKKKWKIIVIAILIGTFLLGIPSFINVKTMDKHQKYLGILNIYIQSQKSVELLMVERCIKSKEFIALLSGQGVNDEQLKNVHFVEITNNKGVAQVRMFIFGETEKEVFRICGALKDTMPITLKRFMGFQDVLVQEEAHSPQKVVWKEGADINSAVDYNDYYAANAISWKKVILWVIESMLLVGAVLIFYELVNRKVSDPDDLNHEELIGFFTRFGICANDEFMVILSQIYNTRKSNVKVMVTGWTMLGDDSILQYIESHVRNNAKTLRILSQEEVSACVRNKYETGQLLCNVKEDYTIFVMDSMEKNNDMLVLCEDMDIIFFIVESGRVNIDKIEKAVNKIDKHHGSVTGIIFIERAGFLEKGNKKRRA